MEDGFGEEEAVEEAEAEAEAGMEEARDDRVIGLPAAVEPLSLVFTKRGIEGDAIGLFLGFGDLFPFVIRRNSRAELTTTEDGLR